MTDISFATYATLYQGRARVLEFNSTATADDGLLLDDLRTATEMIDAALPDVSFMPRVQTRYFDAPTGFSDGDARGRDLVLDVPLRSVTSVVNGDGSTITDYTLYPRNGAPYNIIRLNASSGLYWSTDAHGEYRDAIAVSGVWAGSNIRFIAGDWIDSGDAVGLAIASATTTSVQITDIDGVDAMQRTPRFSPGNLISVTVASVTEYMEVLAHSALTASPNTLTVRRGARGTTALTSIPLNTAISVWQPDRQIVLACGRQAAFLHRSNGVFDKTEFDIGSGTGTKRNTSAWDSKAWEIVSNMKQTARPTFKVSFF